MCGSLQEVGTLQEKKCKKFIIKSEQFEKHNTQT